MKATGIQARLRKLGSKERAKTAQRFFKTGPGEYGEGDVFLGIPVPVLRKVAKEEGREVPIGEVLVLLRSAMHEERLLALLMLAGRFAAADESGKREIYRLYLEHTRFIDNWDLVDLSAPQIAGEYLRARNKAPLRRLARSPRLWERRIAMVATHRFIRCGEFGDALEIAKLLLADEEDLIHKAVGWMLREIGKRDLGAEERFLKEHYRKMPRTMLRYAIERFPEPRRKAYLEGRV